MTANSLLVCQQAHVGAIIEEDSNDMVGQLVAEAVLVGVVHPFSHPLEAAAHVLVGEVLSWREEGGL